MLIFEYPLLLQRLHEYWNLTQRPEFMLVSVISGLSGHHGKNYCYPSQEKILELLAYLGRKMSRRTLNRHLNALVRDGWIKRVRRHRTGPSGMEFHSSLYTLTRRAFRWLAGMGKAVGRAISFGKSRVSNLTQYISYRKKNHGGGASKGASPPPEDPKSLAGTAGEGWEDKKKASAPHLQAIKALLHG